jgi:hypothetical protein
MELGDAAVDEDAPGCAEADDGGAKLDGLFVGKMDLSLISGSPFRGTYIKGEG